MFSEAISDLSKAIEIDDELSDVNIKSLILNNYSFRLISIEANVLIC